MNSPIGYAPTTVLFVLMSMLIQNAVFGNVIFQASLDSKAQVLSHGGACSGGDFPAGRTGNGYLSADKGHYISFPTRGRFNLKEGTIEFWVKPEWRDESTHILFDTLRVRDDVSDRLVITGSRTTLSVDLIGYPEKGAFPVDNIATADISRWRNGEWHHVALTWKGVDSGRPNVVIRLFLDGAQAATVRPGDLVYLEHPPVTFTIGSGYCGMGLQASHAVIDEFCINDTAKSASQIAKVRETMNPGTGAERP